MVDVAGEHERLDGLFDDLFPLTRSITGPGLRASLDRIGDEMPLDVEAVHSGTEVYDWEVPPEWRITEARLEGPDGTVYADYDETNLAVVNYSAPVDRRLELDELDEHLYTHPDVPEATPYVTSYYERTWGFCLPHAVYEDLPDGEYHAYVDSEFVDGELNYGHTVLEGETDEEILLSTYLCHPSLANNELSGPLVATSLYRRLAERDDRHYTYRFVFAPETIGSLCYLSRYGDHLQEHLAGGLVLTCLGGPKSSLSYKTTRRGDALLDELVRHLDAESGESFELRPFTPTSGSDERQYCSPGFDLPVGQMARTVYGEYEEYHNSHDDKAFMGIEPLVEAAEIVDRVLELFEYAGYYRNLEPYGEPMLSKRDLYPEVNSPETWSDSTPDVRDDEGEFLDKILTVLNYADSTHSMVEIAERYGGSLEEFVPIVDVLRRHGLLVHDESSSEC